MSPSSDGSKQFASFSAGNFTPKEEVNVWCIFTKAAGNAPMKYKLLTFSHSLLENANMVTVSLHVIVDTSSQRIAQEILNGVQDSLKKKMKVSCRTNQKLRSEIFSMCLSSQS